MKADLTCDLIVKDGKVWCETHQTNEHPISWDWEHHRDKCFLPAEGPPRLPMRHILYTCFLCPCGTILMDEEV